MTVANRTALGSSSSIPKSLANFGQRCRHRVGSPLATLKAWLAAFGSARRPDRRSGHLLGIRDVLERAIGALAAREPEREAQLLRDRREHRYGHHEVHRVPDGEAGDEGRSEVLSRTKAAHAAFRAAGPPGRSRSSEAGAAHRLPASGSCSAPTACRTSWRRSPGRPRARARRLPRRRSPAWPCSGRPRRRGSAATGRRRSRHARHRRAAPASVRNRADLGDRPLGSPGRTPSGLPSVTRRGPRISSCRERRRIIPPPMMPVAPTTNILLPLMGVPLARGHGRWFRDHLVRGHAQAAPAAGGGIGPAMARRAEAPAPHTSTVEVGAGPMPPPAAGAAWA